MVDAADYTVWRDNLGSGYYLNNSGDESDGSAAVVDAADYDLWRIRFGQTAGSGAGATRSANSAVPEPTSAAVVLLAAIVLVTKFRLPKKSR